MAYKKYFYKFGKRFGPYYYHSYRDKKGNVGKRYMGKKNPDLNKIIIRILIALIITAIIFLSIVFYHSFTNKNSLSSGLSSEKPENKTIWVIIIAVLIILILFIMFFLIIHMLKIMLSKSIIERKK